MRRAFLLLLIFPSLVFAAPPTKDELPPALRPWSAWVLHGREGETCPFLQDQGGTRCGWAGRLELNLSESGGTFSQEWTLFARNFAQLPGSERHWPVDVRVNGAPAAVVSREGIPHLDLEAGIYRVTGTFLWNKLPESLALPLQTGIVSLRVRGAPVSFPTRSESGALWLRGAAAQAGEADALEITAHRRVIDEVPLRVLTHLELRISGKSREELLGKILLEEFIPLSLSSPLPARIEPDGRLRVQARPGVWHLWLEARHVGPINEIPLSDPGMPWAAEEVWVFDARPDLRVVDVEGPQAIDPQQTTLPEDWKNLPSYRVTSGETMKFVERRRGNADPAPDRLTLKRDLWLDFDGTGYTVRDQMGGALSRSWRLEMGEGQVLERAILGGEDQVITTREGSDLRGFEIRQGTVDLSAESRIEDKVSSLPAVGWAHDFQEVSAILHLPPGWRIVSALGVDEVPGTWTRRWTLLDFFLVLIAALAFRKLWGTRWGALALAGLVLSYHEPGVPKWTWLWVLGAEALLRLLKESRFRRLVAAGRIGLAGTLLLLLIPFSVQQIRQAMYPVLEYPDWEVGGDRMRRESFLEGMVMPHERKAKEAEVYDEIAQEEMPAAAPEAPAPQALGVLGSAALSTDVAEFSKGQVRGYKRATAILQQIDPKAAVSTGPGLPAWEWNQIELRWSGTVEKDHRIRLFLLSPPVNFFLAWVRVILLSLLALCVIGLPSDVWPEKWRKWFVPAGTAAGLFLFFSVVPARAQGEDLVPRQEILDQLRDRLLEKQPCYPRCAEASRLLVEASESTLRLRLEIHAQAPLAVPLPGSAGQWLPAQVFVDGAPARTLLGAPGGVLWLEISKGRHDVVLEGPLPERESLQITLPLEPRLAGARASGWRVDGIDEEGRVQGSLSLTRTARASGAKQKGFEPEALPPFVRVVRTLWLGLRWEVETSVERVSPLGTPIVLEVPLLAGEKVTNEGVRVKDGKVQVALGAQQGTFSWSSSLPETPEIPLAAPKTASWVEAWRLGASTLWHTESEGIPPVLPVETEEDRVVEWRPWPGEEVKIQITRPEGVEAQTLTIDSAYLTVTPGLRQSESSLAVQLRSSRGGQHAMKIPEGAELSSLSIDGAPQPVRQEGSLVQFSIRPGAQQVDLSWREPRGVSAFYRVSPVDLGAPAVNGRVYVNYSTGRWILFVLGPMAGPAVLFWSLLVIVLVVSAGLGRTTLTPLRSRDWALLGIGLSQVPVFAAAVVAVWLLLLGLRGRRGAEVEKRGAFNLMQAFLVFLSVQALVVLFWSIQQGLLGPPEMQIVGNGSSASELRWFQDRVAGEMPRPWVLSAPILLYRLAMLAWALWLAFALLKWLRWGWDCLTAGGGWRKRPAVATARPPTNPSE